MLIWVQSRVHIEHGDNKTRAYVLIDQKSPDGLEIVGYFCICADCIYKDGKNTPAVLIEQLARDFRRDHTGLGSILIIEALRKAIEASDIIGIQAIHLFPTSAGKRLYLDHEFEAHPYGEGCMMLPIITAKAVVAEVDEAISKALGNT